MKGTEKTKIWSVITFLMGAFMFYAGVQHFRTPILFLNFVPSFLPFKIAIIYISGLVELIVGVLLFIKNYQGIGAFILFVLMIIFLPIHIWDVFSATPAIGSHQAALIRLPLQVILIGIAWKLKIIYSNKHDYGTT